MTLCFKKRCMQRFIHANSRVLKWQLKSNLHVYSTVNDYDLILIFQYLRCLSMMLIHTVRLNGDVLLLDEACVIKKNCENHCFSFACQQAISLFSMCLYQPFSLVVSKLSFHVPFLLFLFPSCSVRDGLYSLLCASVYVCFCLWVLHALRNPVWCRCTCSLIYVHDHAVCFVQPS